MGEDETRAGAAEGTHITWKPGKNGKEGRKHHISSVHRASRGQVVNYMPIVGLRVCPTDTNGKERTRREGKSVSLERHQIKYPFRGVFQGTEECERMGSVEGLAKLGTQCLFTWVIQRSSAGARRYKL